ncbi:hypothetical protein GH140_04945 [bacterium]|nr:hypothetical protein [bacterium]
MFSRRKQKKKIKKALDDSSLLQLRANLKNEKRPFKIFHTAELYERVTKKASKTQNRH